VLYIKHFNWRTAPGRARDFLRLLLRGRTNFLRGMMLYPSIFNVNKMLSDHALPVKYEMPLRPERPAATKQSLAKAAKLYIHTPKGRSSRNIDDATERFVENTRMGGAD
jgi:hypothetical protein